MGYILFCIPKQGNIFRNNFALFFVMPITFQILILLQELSFLKLAQSQT
jgi:hypothetical protein